MPLTEERILEILKKQIDIGADRYHSKKPEPTPFNKMFLGDIPRTQSPCIRMGFIVEGWFNALRPKLDDQINIDKIKVKCGKTGKVRNKQIDLVSLLPNRDIIYCESKNCLELDSEKKPETIRKLYEVGDAIQQQYPNNKVKSYIVTAGYSTKDDIPEAKFGRGLTRENVLGYNDLIHILAGVKINENSFKQIISEYARSAFFSK